VDFRVLGPLEAVDDGGAALPLGGSRQRLVLALLILEANRVVPSDQLIDRVWGDEPPGASRASLFAYVSRLRKVLGTGRIEARPPGYVLRAERIEIDLLRFTDLVDAARETDDRAARTALLSEALGLWRGDPLSDLAGHDALRPTLTRLEEQRLSAIEDRIDADLDLGRHRDAIATLEGLTRQYPLREQLWSRLMLALYRSGRQGDALGAFHRARTTLVEELGIDPSPELLRLHEQVLRQDPALDLQPTQPTQTLAPTSPPAAAAAALRARRRPIISIAGVGLVALLAATAAWWLGLGRAAVPPSQWTIGLSVPLSGDMALYGTPVRNAVQMAVDDLNASGDGGSTFRLDVRDDAADPARAADHARAFATDATTVAMIGPWGSSETFPVIPITNTAGLLQCSPSATHPGLTKPRYGALDLRAAHPDVATFIRLAPSDDIQSLALATFGFHDLAASSALVVDDTGAGREIADAFEKEFASLGGTTIRRALNPDALPRTVLAPLADELDPPRLVFFEGAADTAAALRLAMAEAGRLSIPLLSWDALLYGPGGRTTAYIERVGPAAAVGSYAAHASLPDQKFSFADAYRRRFGSEPDEYAGAGYACVEIVAASQRAAAGGVAGTAAREAVRSYAVDQDHRFETVLGTVAFDANGDALRQFVTFYRVEPSAASGSGDWVIVKKQDFGPAA